jgi:hypothetical protein
MPKLNDDKQKKDAFELYLKYNGENLPAIAKEMRALGYPKFNEQRIRKSDGGGGFTGWETEYNWKRALETHQANIGKLAMTTAEGLQFEVEAIRKTLYKQIQEAGEITEQNKWLLWEHKKYTNETGKILAQLEAARDNYGNFVFFLGHLLGAAASFSPALAKELCDAEEALIDWAESKFVTAKAEEI